MESKSGIPTREEREELRRLHAATTQGEWEAENKGQRHRDSAHMAITDENSKVICDTLNADGQEIHEEPDEDGVYYYEGGQRDKDMEFIAAAHNALPGLLDAIDTLEQRLAAAEEKLGYAQANYEAQVIASQCLCESLDNLALRLAAAEADTARRCAEIAMERCRLLNGDAVAQIRSGRPEMASVTEIKADQFEWIANAIRREFRLDAPRKEGKP